MNTTEKMTANVYDVMREAVKTLEEVIDFAVTDDDGRIARLIANMKAEISKSAIVSINTLDDYTFTDTSLIETLKESGIAWKKISDGLYSFILPMSQDEAGHNTSFCIKNLSWKDFLSSVMDQKKFSFQDFLTCYSINLSDVTEEAFPWYVGDVISYANREVLFNCKNGDTFYVRELM